MDMKRDSYCFFVCRQPENKLAFTNYVYVHPDCMYANRESHNVINSKSQANGENKIFDNYIQIGKHVFLCQGHAAIQPGTIGMNQKQRDTCNLSENDTIHISNFEVPQEVTFQLHSACIEFETIGPQKIRFNEQEMLPFIKLTLANQVLFQGQTLWGKYDSHILVLRVLAMTSLVKDQTKLTVNTTMGRFLMNTKTKLSVAPDMKHLLFLEESDERCAILDPDWSFREMGIGGLDKEFGMLFRRAFASRLFPAKVIEQLGIQHVKGMLLYGPPGTGKTLIARQIGKLLRGREPKVVNGPEILNKFVGQSEENIRNLFKDAEDEQAKKKEKSSLHIIIFDEIDAICKARGSNTGSTGVHDTIVNQLLSKIDGVHGLNNILVIGMTNRKDMIDPALLRPGRLEVHIEIGLPDTLGREQILGIHTQKMREHKKMHSDVDLKSLAEQSKNFSGAEIEGLVKSASSFALYHNINVDKVDVNIDAENIVVQMSHFQRALSEVTPAFGIADDDLKAMMPTPLLSYSSDFDDLMKLGYSWIEQVKTSSCTPLLSVLLEGPAGCGKTALAAKLAMLSGFPYIKVVSPEMFLGFNETAKCAAIVKIFEDAYKSPYSLIFLDNIERLLDYVAIGPRFSNQVLQTLLVLIKRIPPRADRKLLIMATTSSFNILKDMEFKQTFDVIHTVPCLTKPEHILKLFTLSRVQINEKEIDRMATKTILPLGIKQALMFIEMAKVAGKDMFAARFLECVAQFGSKNRSNS